MKLAALYDVHGNLDALDAVLAEVAELEVDRVLVGGDVVPGPFSRQCVERLRGLQVPVDWIRGNGELAVLSVVSGGRLDLPESVVRQVAASAQQFDPETLSWMARWPRTHQIQVAPDLEVLFCHATPRDENEIFTELTSEERLSEAFSQVEAEVVVCGHTHLQFDRPLRSMGRLNRVLNAGSVGLPFGASGAFWLLIEDQRLELRVTEYDVAAAVDRVRALDLQGGVPGAADFALQLSQPRTREEILALFSQSELGSS